jgi:hypothetical protein
MTHSQNEEQKMMLDITGLALKNPEKFQNRPTLNGLFNTVVANCALVQANASVQLNDKSSITTEKNLLREQTVNSLKRQLRISQGFFANKALTGNEKTATDLLESLRAAQDLEIKNVATAYINLVEPYAAQTIEFGITTEGLEKLTNLVNTYHTLTASIGNEKSSVATATLTIHNLLRANIAIIKSQIDRMMEVFAETDPTFYAEYKRLRKINYRRGSKTPATEEMLKPYIKLNTIDALTKSPVPNASISVDGAAQPELTDEDGEFSMDSLSLGQHEFMALADGYKPISLLVNLTDATEEYAFELELLKV